MNYYHNSVMPHEVIEYLKVENNKTYVDCTLGGCGHSKLILEKASPNGQLIGFDQDSEAIKNSESVLSEYKKRVIVHNANFSSIKNFIEKSQVDGILADLGVSSHHLDNAQRGFSFSHDGPLDMRMNKTSNFTAGDLINEYSKEEIYKILKKYGEEKFASRIAGRIVEKRKNKKIDSTMELAEIVKNAIPAKFSHKMNIHPATKTFMAIRIEVNNELKVLEKFLDDAPYLLKQGGRLCILTFHSLEDRIVKHKFKDLTVSCTCPPKLPVCVCGKKQEFKIITRKPLMPTKEEIDSNPRARSTKLRVLEKL